MKYIKAILLFIILFGFYLYINSDLILRIDYLFLESLIFTIVSEALIFRPSLRLIFILISVVLFIIMIVLFVCSSLEALMTGILAEANLTAEYSLVVQANFFGSLAFGIFLISLIFYLPQLIKKGYIENP